MLRWHRNPTGCSNHRACGLGGAGGRWMRRTGGDSEHTVCISCWTEQPPTTWTCSSCHPISCYTVHLHNKIITPGNIAHSLWQRLSVQTWYRESGLAIKSSNLFIFFCTPIHIRVNPQCSRVAGQRVAARYLSVHDASTIMIVEPHPADCTGQVAGLDAHGNVVVLCKRSLVLCCSTYWAYSWYIPLWLPSVILTMWEHNK